LLSHQEYLQLDCAAFCSAQRCDCTSCIQEKGECSFTDAFNATNVHEHMFVRQ